MNSSSSIPLNYIGSGKFVIVDKVNGSENMCKKLMEMGINKGATIKMVKNNAGTLMIKLGSSRLVIGRGMGEKVFV
ncbi:MAG: FeoA family protein, partial [Clostridium sp.]|nr:FeoA family protein [Clostridium sp.]